jgi:hypothetical protein
MKVVVPRRVPVAVLSVGWAVSGAGIAEVSAVLAVLVLAEDVDIAGSVVEAGAEVVVAESVVLPAVPDCGADVVCWAGDVEPTLVVVTVDNMVVAVKGTVVSALLMTRVAGGSTVAVEYTRGWATGTGYVLLCRAVGQQTRMPIPVITVRVAMVPVGRHGISTRVHPVLESGNHSQSMFQFIASQHEQWLPMAGSAWMCGIPMLMYVVAVLEDVSVTARVVLVVAVAAEDRVGVAEIWLVAVAAAVVGDGTVELVVLATGSS